MKVYYDKGPLSIVVNTTERTFKKITMYECEGDYVTIVHETGSYGPKLILDDLDEFFKGQGYNRRPKEKLRELLLRKFKKKEEKK